MFTIEILVRYDDGSVNKITKLARSMHVNGLPVKHNIVQNSSRLEAVKAAIRILEVEQQFLEETAE